MLNKSLEQTTENAISNLYKLQPVFSSRWKNLQVFKSMIEDSTHETPGYLDLTKTKNHGEFMEVVYQCSKFISRKCKY